MLNYLKDYFKDWNTWDYCWTFIASIVGTWIGLQWGEGGWQTWFSIITMLTGMWCVILVAKGRIFNYYIGIVNCLMYAYIAYGYQLYGEVQLNLIYYFPMQIYGLWLWRRNRNPEIKDAVKVKFLSLVNRTHVGATVLVATVLYAGYLMHLGDPLPWLDATSTVLSITAMVLLTWRYMEQWILWIIVDIVSVWMWIEVVMEKGTNDIALLVMWSAFLINAVYGFVSWIRMYKKQELE